MRVALLSDIHSNVYALDAVINDLKQRGVDCIVNLGDILYGPIAPKDTYELLMEHSFVTISGNQDRQIVEATTDDINANPTMAFIVKDLGTKPIDWMASLPFDYQLTDDIYLCHGTPESDLVYLLEDVSSGEARVRSNADITQLLGGNSSKVICCGHTHLPRTIMLDSGQTIVNPGSVGLQAYTDDLPVKHSMENFHPFASYAIIEQTKNEQTKNEQTKNGWNTEHIKVPYALESAVKACQQRERVDWVHFLTTGRRL